jgi:hypothetical protein
MKDSPSNMLLMVEVTLLCYRKFFRLVTDNGTECKLVRGSQTVLGAVLD